MGKLLKTHPPHPPGSVFQILEKKHTVGNRLVFEKTKYPANTAPDQVKQYPYYCLIVVSLCLFLFSFSFLMGRRFKNILTNLGAFGQRFQKHLTNLGAFGQRFQNISTNLGAFGNCGWQHYSKCETEPNKLG